MQSVGRDALNDLRIVDKKALLQLIPYSLAQIWRLEKAGRFPQRIQLGPNRVGWRLSDLQEWIRSRPAAALPLSLPRGRGK